MDTDKKCRPFHLLLLSVSIRAPFVAIALLFFLAPVCGCDRSGPGGEAVVVYTSVDDPVARPILQEFTRRTGVRVEVRTDTEANKSAGLAARLEAEKSNPKADVWWGNEVFRTIRLADAGVLAAYDSPSASDVPPLFKDPNHLWTGAGLRVRVIGVHAGNDAPPGGGAWLPNGSIEDLTRPELKGRVAMANPRAGTTSGHVAALYVLWGDAKAAAFFRGLRDNGVKVVGGNGDVAAEVSTGTVWVGLTDNDDVDNVSREGGSIRAVLPDQKAYGTLTIPCTVALVAGSKHTDAAKKLVDYLLSAEVEKRLVDAKFASATVRGGSGELKAMQVDYRDVAKVLDRAANDAHAILTGQ
jgi:iron(III) transport system substrate-binding protein